MYEDIPICMRTDACSCLLVVCVCQVFMDTRYISWYISSLVSILTRWILHITVCTPFVYISHHETTVPACRNNSLMENERSSYYPSYTMDIMHHPHLWRMMALWPHTRNKDRTIGPETRDTEESPLTSNSIPSHTWPDRPDSQSIYMDWSDQPDSDLTLILAH